MKKPTIKTDKSLREIADETDLSLSYISRVLRGERIPRIHFFKRIADALQLTMDDLYKKLKGFYK